MLSMAPNIVFVPNITQNAEHRHRRQDTNTAHFCTFSKPESKFQNPFVFLCHLNFFSFFVEKLGVQK